MATNEYQQGPQLDAAAPALDAQAAQAPAPNRDLQIASMNYWAGRTGREQPPAPTFRMVDGKKTLGRYMDPYGAQAHIRNTRAGWEKWYVPFLISCAVALLLGEITWITWFVFLPVYAFWYFAKKASFRRRYESYFGVQQECLRTNEPQWVPYTKKQLKFMDRNLPAVMP